MSTAANRRPANMRGVHRIAVIGAGLMGHGIALDLSLAGYSVGLHDLTEEALDAGIVRIRDSLAQLHECGLVEAEQMTPALDRITADTQLEAVAGEADLVIESIAENLAEKQALFARLDKVCPPRVILASNSSSFVPSRLATATARPDRVVGAHYFNPPTLIPLVEIVRGAQTSQETVDTVVAVMKTADKLPVRVRKEIPGFIANRIQAAVWREILMLVSEGVASPEEVDQVVKSSIGRRWAVAGPFEITELAGMDLKRSIHAQLLPTLESSTKVPEILEQMVQSGKLGVKTGGGFYDWTEKDPQELRNRIARALTAIAQWDQQLSDDA